MPEDVGGGPFSDGKEPEENHNRGGADDEFASVVFDEDFVRSAPVHEPTAVERLLAAAEARAEASEAEARRGRTRRSRPDDDLYEDGFDPDDGRGRGAHEFDDDLYDPDLMEDGFGRRLRYGSPARWHRPVAWLLALVMGIGMVALAFTAVYRGASSGRHDRVPAPSSEVGKTPSGHAGTSGTSADDQEQPSTEGPSARTHASVQHDEGVPEHSRPTVSAAQHGP